MSQELKPEDWLEIGEELFALSLFYIWFYRDKLSPEQRNTLEKFIHSK